MKSAVLALALLLFGSVAQAGPFGKVKNFVKTHPRFTTAVAALGVGSAIQWTGSNYCQSGNPEVCNLGYGGFHEKSFNIFSISLGVAMIGAAEGCWKDQPGWKFCYGLAYGVPAYQTSVGIKDFLSYKPESKSESTVIKFP